VLLFSDVCRFCCGCLVLLVAACEVVVVAGVVVVECYHRCTLHWLQWVVTHALAETAEQVLLLTFAIARPFEIECPQTWSRFVADLPGHIFTNMVSICWGVT